MMNDTEYLGWSMGFGGLFMILFWGLIIFGIVAVVRWLTGNGKNTGLPEQKTALDILKERYARGEIDEQEFQRKRRDLEQ
ncbi:MAG TPA: SHOCT domain-containing protein [Gammaproteobacteria bacterium]|nr:SHOCT domain-containing protein [Gammaproteobacteria bacterium]